MMEATAIRLSRLPQREGTRRWRGCRTVGRDRKGTCARAGTKGGKRDPNGPEEFRNMSDRSLEKRFKDSSPIPMNRKEVLLSALGCGDLKGIWLNLASWDVVLAALGVAYVATVCESQGVGGTWGTWLCGMSWFVFVAGISAEITKFIEAVMGTESRRKF